MNWYRLRQKDEAGVTVREREVLRWRSYGQSWSAIARECGVSRQRVGSVRLQLEEKGLLTPTGKVSKRGQEYLDAVDG